MEAQFALHRTDDRPFDEGEGGQILIEAIMRTRYPMVLQEITQSNGSVTGNIRLIGEGQYYRIQLLLMELKKVPGIRLAYRGVDD